MQLMSFEEFKTWAAENVKSCMPEDYEEAEVRLHAVEKLGTKYTGLTVMKKGQTIAATVDLDDLYSYYCSGASEDKVLAAIAEIAAMAPPVPIGEDLGLNDYEEFKDRLFIRLGNLQTNQGLIDKVPHRIIEDMVVTYHVVSGVGGRDFWSALISSDLLKGWNVTEEQLHEDALKSSAELFPARLDTMSSILSKAPGPMHVEAVGPEIMVLSNSAGFHGASAVLYPGVLKMAEEELGEDFYIVPSSVNELLLVPESIVDDPSKLLLTHRFVSGQTAVEERLSNLIFRTDPESGRLVNAASQPVS